MKQEQPAGIGPVERGVGRPVPKRATGGLRGFGVTITPGGARNWYAGADGVRRWASNDRPCDAGSHDQPMTPAVQRVIDEADKRARDKAAMPEACPTATGCREHGCHGACMPPNGPVCGQGGHAND
jgi:hypothetical protein